MSKQQELVAYGESEDYFDSLQGMIVSNNEFHFTDFQPFKKGFEKFNSHVPFACNQNTN